MISLKHVREIDKQSKRKRKVENPEYVKEIAERSLRKRKAENPEYRKKINNQKRKVKNSEPISQIKRNYVKVKKTVMSVHQIVNVPSDVKSTVHCLPRLVNESQTIPIKLKRRLSYKHHYQFQNVRPKKVLNAFKYLVGTSDLFKHEGIEVQNSWLDDISLQCSGHEDWTEFVQNHVTLLSANLHAETDETVTKDNTGFARQYFNC